MLAGQAVEKLALDVVDVLDALGEVAVGHLGEDGGVVLHDGADGIFGGAVVIADFGADLIDEGLVLEDADVEVEDSGDFLALAGEEFVALGGEFLDGLVEGLRKPLKLGVGRTRGNISARE